MLSGFHQSLDIFNATWEENWYLLDVANQKIIALMLLRSQKPKYVKVPFFEVTLIAYTKVNLIQRPTVFSHEFQLTERVF